MDLSLLIRICNRIIIVLIWNRNPQGFLFLFRRIVELIV